MDFLLKTIIYSFRFYVYISAFIYFYAKYKGRDLDCNPILGISKFNNFFFGFGCFIFLIFLFTGGFQKVLFFIPESWGGLNKDGDWQSTKETFSGLLSFFATVGVMLELDEIFKRKVE